MPRATLAVDGLWLALCPSFSPASLSRPISCARPKHVRCSPHVNSTCQREFTSEARVNARKTHQRIKLSLSAQEGRQDQSQVIDVLPDIDKDVQDKERDKGMPALLARMKHLWGRGFSDVQQQDTPALYELLRISATLEKSKEVEYLVDLLVRVRHEQPNARLYSALILSNAVPETGSISRVHALLEEMEREGIPLDVGICHDVLKVGESRMLPKSALLTVVDSRGASRLLTARGYSRLHGSKVDFSHRKRKKLCCGRTAERRTARKGCHKPGANADGRQQDSRLVA